MKKRKISRSILKNERFKQMNLKNYFQKTKEKAIETLDVDNIHI